MRLEAGIPPVEKLITDSRENKDAVHSDIDADKEHNRPRHETSSNESRSCSVYSNQKFGPNQMGDLLLNTGLIKKDGARDWSMRSLSSKWFQSLESKRWSAADDCGNVESIRCRQEEKQLQDCHIGQAKRVIAQKHRASARGSESSHAKEKETEDESRKKGDEKPKKKASRSGRRRRGRACSPPRRRNGEPTPQSEGTSNGGAKRKGGRENHMMTTSPRSPHSMQWARRLLTKDD